MEEMKKFLRYVVPGLVFIIEISIVILIILIFENKDLLKIAVSKVFEHGQNIGTAFTLLLISGGIGAFLASIYHFLVPLPFVEKLGVNYTKLLKKCINDGHIELRTWEDKKVDFQDLSVIGQWRLFTSFWHINKDTSDMFKGAERRSETLHDISHGQGTQLVGAIFVLLSLVVINNSWLNGFSIFWYILPIIIIVVHLKAFINIINSIQTVLHNFYIRGFRDNKMEKPIILYVYRSDIKIRHYLKY